MNETKNLSLRLIEEEDCIYLYQWRNHPSARVASRFTHDIPYGEHEKWFFDSLKNTSRKIYMGLEGIERIGQIRFDKEEEESEVSITINPEKQGRGYGSEILRIGSERYFNEEPEIKIIRAEIRPKNISSIKIFEKNGYKFSKEKDTPYGPFLVLYLYRDR